MANEKLVGSNAEQRARVTQWTNFSDQEIMPAVCTWVFPCMGIMQFNKSVSTGGSLVLSCFICVLYFIEFSSVTLPIFLLMDHGSYKGVDECDSYRSDFRIMWYPVQRFQTYRYWLA